MGTIMTGVGRAGVGAVLEWEQCVEIMDRLSSAVAAEGRPDAVVGILRGGMVPAVLLVHALGVRDLRAVEVTHTAADGVNAAKTAQPQVGNPASLGEVGGLDVVVVDDVAGTGETVIAAAELVRAAGAARVRSVVCAVNEINWFAARHRRPDELLDHVGIRCHGWVIFPWEQRS